MLEYLLFANEIDWRQSFIVGVKDGCSTAFVVWNDQLYRTIVEVIDDSNYNQYVCPLLDVEAVAHYQDLILIRTPTGVYRYEQDHHTPKFRPVITHWTPY